jgi:hypothetical protein
MNNDSDLHNLCAGLATEDGASPNKKANIILNQDMAVCSAHDIARAVLLASGEDGKPCKNPELKALTARSSKQGGSFHRSVVATTRHYSRHSSMQIQS